LPSSAKRPRASVCLVASRSQALWRRICAACRRDRGIPARFCPTQAPRRYVRFVTFRVGEVKARSAQKGRH
jgi:hypothetical protein